MTSRPSTPRLSECPKRRTCRTVPAPATLPGRGPLVGVGVRHGRESHDAGRFSHSATAVTNARSRKRPTPAGRPQSRMARGDRACRPDPDVHPRVRSSVADAGRLESRQGSRREWRAGEVLQAFGGLGVVRVYEHGSGGLLLERLDPGTSLASLALADDDEATRIVARTIAAMAPVDSPAGVPGVREWGRAFGSYLASDDARIAAALVRDAQAAYTRLCDTQTRVRLLHGDLHHDNILFDTNRGWVAIDPKGVVGEAGIRGGRRATQSAHRAGAVHRSRDHRAARGLFRPGTASRSLACAGLGVFAGGARGDLGDRGRRGRSAERGVDRDGGDDATDEPSMKLILAPPETAAGCRVSRKGRSSGNIPSDL